MWVEAIGDRVHEQAPVNKPKNRETEENKNKTRLMNATDLAGVSFGGCCYPIAPSPSINLELR